MIAAALIGASYIGSEAQDAVRAYVGGEAIWSKAQKDAVYYLERYADTGDEALYRRFEAAIATPLEDKRARLALQRDPPDIDAAREALIRAGHPPADVPRLIRMFGWRDYVPFFARAIGIWTEADREIDRLSELALELRREIAASGHGGEAAEDLITEIEAVNERLTALEHSFSDELGEGARWLLRVSRLFTLLAGLLLALAGILLVRRTAVATRQAHARWQRARQMEALGRLAGGVAHDFNNLMTAVLGHADILEPEIADRAEAREHLREIRNAAGRAAKLTRQLLAFGRRQPLAPETVDLCEVVRELAPMLRGVIPESMPLAIETAREPVWAEIDRLGLEQAVMNVVLNSRDAIVGSGRIGVSVSELEITAGKVPDLGAGRYAVVEVTDSGVGMDETVRGRVFEPFFTTKGPGEGTGLGLSMAYGLARQSGGTVTIDSNPGRGTVVRFYLPRAAAPAQEVGPSPERRKAARRSTTILLVEDDDDVRALLSRSLADQGHRILAAPSGDEALSLAKQHQGAIDLLITDVIMPGRSGPAIAAELQRLRPGLKVLFISGYPGEELERHGVPPGAELLPKPFGPLALQIRVEEILGRREQAAG